MVVRFEKACVIGPYAWVEYLTRNIVLARGTDTGYPSHLLFARLFTGDHADGIRLGEHVFGQC